MTASGCNKICWGKWQVGVKTKMAERRFCHLGEKLQWRELLGSHWISIHFDGKVNRTV